MNLANADDWYFLADEDLTSGLALIVSLWHPLTRFEGAGKTRLLNPEVKDAVHDLVLEAFEQFSEQHPDQMERIVRHCLDNKAMRDKRRFGEP